MKKAYDRVSWDFLKSMLQAYGFSTAWIELVITLVTTVSYTYQVNAFSSRKVLPKRGLRQGDPLSPYLYILVFDVLSRLITDVVSKNHLQGSNWQNLPLLSYIYFLQMMQFFLQETLLNMYSSSSKSKISSLMLMVRRLI